MENQEVEFNQMVSDISKKESQIAFKPFFFRLCKNDLFDDYTYEDWKLWDSKYGMIHQKINSWATNQIREIYHGGLYTASDHLATELNKRSHSAIKELTPEIIKACWKSKMVVDINASVFQINFKFIAVKWFWEIQCKIVSPQYTCLFLNQNEHNTAITYVDEQQEVKQINKDGFKILFEGFA